MIIKLNDIYNAANSFYVNDSYLDSYENTFCKDDIEMYRYQILESKGLDSEIKKKRIKNLNKRKDRLKEAIQVLKNEKAKREEDIQRISNIIKIKKGTEWLLKIRNTSKININICALRVATIGSRKDDDELYDQYFKLSFRRLDRFIVKNWNKFSIKELTHLFGAAKYTSLLPYDNIKMRDFNFSVDNVSDESVKILKRNKKITKSNKTEILKVLDYIKSRRCSIRIIPCSIDIPYKNIIRDKMIFKPIKAWDIVIHTSEYMNNARDYDIRESYDGYYKDYSFIITEDDEYYDKIISRFNVSGKKHDLYGNACMDCINILYEKFEKLRNDKEINALNRFYRDMNKRVKVLKKILNELDSQIASLREEYKTEKGLLKESICEYLKLIEDDDTISMWISLQEELSSAIENCIDRKLKEYNKEIYDINNNIHAMKHI